MYDKLIKYNREKNILVIKKYRFIIQKVHSVIKKYNKHEKNYKLTDVKRVASIYLKKDNVDRGRIRQ